VARADDEPSARERGYGEHLALRLGEGEQPRVERVTRPGARGVRVSLDGITSERLRFGSPAEAEAFARGLAPGEAGLIEVRGEQVFVARGPRLAEPEVAARLRASGWDVLRAPAAGPSVVRDLGDGRTRGRASASTASPTVAPTVARPVEPVTGSVGVRADNHGVTELLGHHLLGEELRELGQSLFTGAVDPLEVSARLAPLLATVPPETMGAHQRGRVAPAYAALSPSDRAAFDALLEEYADQPAVRDQLLRALAASSSIEDVRWLAGQLDGRDAAWIAENTRLTGPQGGSSLAQQWQDSCAPTTAQALRGEYDPVYALRTRQENLDVTTVPKGAGNEALAREQRTLLESNGGRAVPVGDGGGGGLADADWIRVLDAAAPQSGLTFTQEGSFDAPLPADRTIALLDEHLSEGRVVPLGISNPGGGGGHAVLATAVRRDAAGEPEFLVFDPAEGVSAWLTTAAIREQRVNIAGWNLIDTVLVPGRAT
jgi:hypothetical protein